MTTPFNVITSMRHAAALDWPSDVNVQLENELTDHPERIANADVLIHHVFTAAMAAHANRLKLVQGGGAGTEHINFDALPVGCVVANVYEHEQSMAEWLLMAMLALNRHALAADRTLRDGSWVWSYGRTELPVELSAQTLAIVGLGHIGREVARLAKAFRMRVVAATRTPRASPDVDAAHGMDKLNDVLAEVITCC